MPSVSKFHKAFVRAALKHQAHKNGWAAAEGLGAGLGMEDLDMRNDVKSPQQALKEALTEVKADFERKDREKLEAAARRERNSNPLLAGVGIGDSAQNIAGLLPRCNKRQRKAVAYALGRLVADRLLA